MTPGAGPSSAAPWIFWLSLLFLSYIYFLYPVLIAWVGRRRARAVARAAGHRPAVTAIVAARNEARNIARRIENLLGQEYPEALLDVIAVSDGSTDGTARVLQALAEREGRLKVMVFEKNRGKAAALNAAVAEARGEVLVFTDARQEFAPDAVARLAENFADAAVGAASGELMLRAEGGLAQQVGLYWRYEKWIRQSESAAGSMLGATGAIYALRRELWRPLPDGTILDDFLAPMRVVLGGRRAIFDGRAVAWDQAEEAAGREFRRKVRTLAGNFQAFALEPGLLAPWRNPTWFQVWSHKVFRLGAPWGLLALFGSALVAQGFIYDLAAWTQIIFYGAALAGLAAQGVGRPVRNRLVSLAAAFTTLNAAAAWALVVWAQGRSTEKIWK